MNMKFCIWGCGIRGKNIFRFMDKADVCAFIDSSPVLQGTEYEGIPIISFEWYLKEHRDCVVIVTPHYEHYEILDKLEREGVEALSALLLPPEIFEMPVPELFEIIENKTKAEGTLFLYGLNLYSLMLLARFHCKRPIRVIPEEGAARWLLRRTESCFPGCLGTLEEVGGNVLYLTSNEYENRHIPVENQAGLYDFMSDIEAYYNPQIAKFKGIHAGKRCFIIATGPSLRIEDLERLRERGEICIGMNGIFKAYPLTLWRPEYFVLEDRDLFEEWKEILLNEEVAKHVFVSDSCLRGCSYQKFIKFHLSYLQVQPYCKPPFSGDFARGAYESGTVTYDCLQLAVYMGCSEIYLYGLDFSYGKHFTDHYSTMEKGLPESAFQDARIRAKLGYESAKRAAEKAGVKIYNVSRKTELSVFERVDFDEVLNGKGEAI
ncbi:6-hydroxymethylpterin diphosphokinase MptE-like protein [uncultured Oscillibacter sp.]|uniref:6-hydroxymethylpterin diphosphokinase MptE-like protein n=1 Tax=uncultured Oscillibacter sp. TaxID=876091 RepID=UPI00262C6674|nr:6-hydroxymethylpterin diphosphokinase MptE-like protein [uncultured Oscillibacter sp.]